MLGLINKLAIARRDTWVYRYTLPLAYATSTTAVIGLTYITSTQSDVRGATRMNIMNWKWSEQLRPWWRNGSAGTLHPAGRSRVCLPMCICSAGRIGTSLVPWAIMRVAPLSMCKHEPWPANWSSTSRLYGLLQLTAPHRRNELWSCQGSEAVSGDWRSRLSSPLTGRVEIKIIKPLIWIHHSSTATVAKLQWCIRLYREDRRPVVNTGLISPAYCCISFAY